MTKHLKQAAGNFTLNVSFSTTVVVEVMIEAVVVCVTLNTYVYY